MDAFLQWWQHLPEHMSPVLVTLGPLKIQYYGLMYIMAFITTYLLARYRTRSEPEFGLSDEFHKDILTAAFIGVLAGGRLGYVLFYNFSVYINQPLKIIWPFDLETGQFIGISGMSYHGGMIGVFIACAIFLRRYNKNRIEKISYWTLADLYGPIIPLGYTFGRLGNFINGELYGRSTEFSFGMYFPSSPTPGLRHPSQLYEAFFEGIVCFLIMWFIRKKSFYPKGAMAAFYLMLYGIFRFFIEYFREPDSHLGTVFFKFSMGQVLCFLMIASGTALYIYLFNRRRAELNTSKQK